MTTAPSTALLELGKLIKREQTTHAPIAFAIYKLLSESNIPDDDIQNIGAILTEIASGE
jgi:hypothetical protein